MPGLALIAGYPLEYQTCHRVPRMTRFAFLFKQRTNSTRADAEAVGGVDPTVASSLEFQRDLLFVMAGAAGGTTRFHAGRRDPGEHHFHFLLGLGRLARIAGHAAQPVQPGGKLLRNDLPVVHVQRLPAPDAREFAGEMRRRLRAEAEARGIRLGIENREALEEIPLENDFTLFFKEFADPNICYWHDTGHAQIKENLGFIHHVMHLGSLADRLAGFHIHDVQFPARDHCPPGAGMIDFAALKPLVKPEHIKVFELNPGVPVEDLKRGVGYLKAIWGDE